MKKVFFTLITMFALASCKNEANDVVESTQVDSVAVDSVAVDSVAVDTTLVAPAVAE